MESTNTWYPEKEQLPCINFEHNPPTHLYIPPGQTYRHVCPGCGQETVIRAPFITM